MSIIQKLAKRFSVKVIKEPRCHLCYGSKSAQIVEYEIEVVCGQHDWQHLGHDRHYIAYGCVIEDRLMSLYIHHKLSPGLQKC